ILAPMAGTVTKRYIEAGELVTSGIATFSSGMAIVQIADLSRMRVVCEINEVDVARVRVGQRAEILLDAARGQRYPGSVVSVAPAPVTTGLQNDTSVEIRSGLREGDRALPAAYHGPSRRGVKGIP